MTTDVDVLIIGAGPAGLSAGIVLASQGLQTLICEKRFLPVDKACGEGIMPAGLANLQSLGVRHHLPEGETRPFSGIRYLSPGGHTAAARFREGPGLGVRRLVLSKALLSRAKELEGLEIREGVHAKIDFEANPGHRGPIFAAISKETVTARLVVGADGLHSKIRRQAGLQAAPAKRRRWGIRQHFSVSPWSEYVEVYWGQGIEAYVTPCASDQVGVAFLWDRGRFPTPQDGERLFPYMIGHFPGLQERLRNAHPCGLPMATGPLEQSAISPVAEGLLLIGDAAGYLDAITGEGISLATAQALALQKSVIPLLKASAGSNNHLTTGDLRAYALAHRRITRSYHRMTRMLLFLSRRPSIVDRMTEILKRQPELFQHLLSANMGLAPMWPGFSLSFLFLRRLLG